MIASISINLSSVLPDTASLPVRGEAGATLAPLPSQSDQTSVSATTIPASANSQDRVSLSTTALDMSKNLIEQHMQKTELKKDAAKDQEQKSEQSQKAYVAAGKAFPPFLGDSEELKILKESSPALYREVLRMIVPPPLNLSPSDLQALQGSAVQDSKKQTNSTTA